MEHAKNDARLQSSELSSEQESLILDRVEDRVLRTFREKYGRVSTAERRRTGNTAEHTVYTWTWRGWAWGFSVVFVVASVIGVLMLMLRMGGWKEPILQARGITLLGKHRLSDRVVALTVSAEDTGVLSESMRWNMKMAPYTRLVLTKSARRVRHVALVRGWVMVNVEKGRMKAFTIESRGVRVVVTGTRFTVERGSSWIRVELWRGGVQIERKGFVAIVMKPGMGVRIHWPSQVAQTYTLPPATLAIPQAKVKSQKMAKVRGKEPSAVERLTWLSSQGRYTELHRYALDLANRRHISRSQRRAWLRQVADLLYHRGYEHRALQTLLAMARLGGEGADTDFAMAINACHKIFRADTTECISLGEEYLRLYRKDGVQIGYYACQLAKNLWQRYQSNTTLYAKDRIRAQLIRREYGCIDEK